MKKILVTWWAGFIGSNFLNKYVLSNPEIDFINVDCLTYAGNLKHINQDVSDANNYFFEQVDIRDKESLKKVYQKHNPTDIIHFAAESHVDNSIENPSIFMETNVLWTLNLLLLHKEFDMNRFHYVSTDEVYGELSDDPNDKFKETTSIKPNSPYSVSKTWWDLLTLAYHRTFDVDVTVSRCSNNYGPNQDKEKLIPHFIWLLTNNQKVTLYGDGKNVRDWLYVEDHCDAIWTIFNDGKSWTVYNIWGNTEKTNLEITKEILDGVWLDENWISFVKDRPGHDRRYAIDASKIKNELWREPKYNFKEWIESTITFYKDYFKK